METASPQEDLQLLGQLLQERLESKFPQAVSLQVGCALDQGKLVVLTQHPNEVILEPQLTFATLQQALQSLQVQLAQQVELYLRVAGKKQIYATHDFCLDVGVLHNTNKEVLHLNSPNLDYAANSFEPPEAIRNWSAKKLTFKDNWRLYLADARRSLLPKLKSPHVILVATSGVSLVTVLGIIYLLSRPCVIGGCSLMRNAAQLSQEANQITRWATSEPELTTAQQHLDQASVALQTIPWWSFHYQEAQKLLQNVATDSAILKQTITAFQKASLAANKAQKPPYTLKQLQTMQGLWQEAIAPLESLNASSPVYPIVQQKLPRYRADLDSVNQQLQLEQQALKTLKTAQALAQDATLRQKKAQSLSDWEKVASSWEKAVNLLTSLSTNSTYKQAQDLIVKYRLEQVAISDRLTQEKISDTAYKEAINSANFAKDYQQKNQFAKSITKWNQALKAVQQVPNNTFYYNKAQLLIASYSSALKQAEEQQKIAKILTTARTDLNRTCSREIHICNYSLSSKGITVQITSAYELAVEQNYINAKRQGDLNTEAGVANHYQTLRQALEVISDNAGLPLKVYDPEGSLIHTYVNVIPQ